MPRPSDVLAPHASISRTQREARNGHRGAAILLTGVLGESPVLSRT